MMTLKIRYNPYTNLMHFLNEDGTGNKYFEALMGKECEISHHVDNIVSTLINQGIDIVYCEMLGRDFDLLDRKLREKKSTVQLILKKEFGESDDVFVILKGLYDRINESYGEYYNVIDSSEEDCIKKIQTNKDKISTLFKSYGTVVEDEVRIAFVGRYSAGKSYLINSIIGTPLLPERDETTTQVIHEIVYSKNIGMNLFYKKDNRERRVSVTVPEDKSIEEQTSIISDVLRQINCKNSEMSIDLELVKIEYPINPKLLKINGKYRIVIYDTPGPSGHLYEKERLKSFFGEQRDTLPVFVLTPKTIEDKDNMGISEDIDTGNKENFSVAHRFVFVNQCDDLYDNQLRYLKKEEPGNYTTLINAIYFTPTIIYGSSRWYMEERFGRVDSNPNKYRYNDLCRYEVYRSNELYHGTNKEDPTGVLTLENEINYYLDNFAEYHKCFKMKNYLSDICVYSEELYSDLVNEEEKRRDKKKQQFKGYIKNQTINAFDLYLNDTYGKQKVCVEGLINEFKAELDPFVLPFQKEKKDKQNRTIDVAHASFIDGLKSDIKAQAEKINRNAIEKIDGIFKEIQKDDSVSLQDLDKLRGLIDEFKKNTKGFKVDFQKKVFNNLFPRWGAIHEMKKWLDKKDKEGDLRLTIKESLNEYYKENENEFEKCKREMEKKIDSFSLTIKTITKEIELIDEHHKRIVEVKNRLSELF